MKVYTGVGSRRTPFQVLEDMRGVGRTLGLMGYGLRTGGADGADTAFQDGAACVGGRVCVYRPEKVVRSVKEVVTWGPPTKEAFKIASTIHPAWGRLDDYSKALHARNVHQVLGPDLKTPSDFVVCWTPDGATSESETSRSTGGTRTAIVVASRYGIRVCNLHDSNAFSNDILFLTQKVRAGLSV